MNTDLITAVLLAPGVLIGAPLMVAVHRAGRHDKAVLAMLDQERASRAAAQAEAEGSPTPDGGQPAPSATDIPAPAPAPVGEGGQIIVFPTRRAV